MKLLIETTNNKHYRLITRIAHLDHLDSGLNAKMIEKFFQILLHLNTVVLELGNSEDT